jgi:hypothetical protein
MAMICRKGEITRGDLKRKWPHRVALPGRKGADLTNSEVMFCAVGALSATPLTCSLRRDDSDFAMVCFVKPGDADPFAKRFGGERLPMTSDDVAHFFCRSDYWGAPQNDMQNLRNLTPA